MRGPREAVNAAVLATAIRVDGLLERHIRRIVAADDRASLFDLHGCRRFGGLAVVLVRPAVILGPMHRLLEAAFRIAERTTALEWLGRWERVLLPGHGGSLRAGCLDGRDARTANDTSSIPRALRYAPDPEYWNPRYEACMRWILTAAAVLGLLIAIATHSPGWLAFGIFIGLTCGVGAALAFI